jgi:cobalt-zinc-cadmium efflux system outer membrane protein
VSLAALLAHADAHAPRLRQSYGQRELARAAQRGAEVLLPSNPELSVAVGPRVSGSVRGVDVEASLMQELELNGQRAARVRAADALGAASEAEIAAVRFEVHSELRSAFYRAIMERERVQLAQRVLAFQREVLRTVERQIAAGELGSLGQRLGQAEVAQSEQELIAQEQVALAARLRLAQLAGWPPEHPPEPLGALPPVREPADVSQLMAAARDQPGVRAALARTREARARVELAEREAWPRPALGVAYRREADRDHEGNYDIFLGALSVPLPLFQTNQAGRAHAHAELVVADTELQVTREALAARIAEARSEVVAAARRAAAYGSEIVPRFEENLTLLRRAFELGEIDILALSAGRERFLRIESAALAARLDYVTALGALERAVGRELSAGEQTP